MQETDFDRVMQTNTKGMFLVLREAARRLKEDARIVTVSTIVSFLASAGASWVTGQVVRANGGWV